MSKNVIICLDGTGNQFNEDNSNVVKLFRVVTRDASQVAYYDPGVGTLADPDYRTPVGKNFSKLLGLGFGKGLTRNVEQAYSFLMDHYEQDDRLFIFGFSRGSYTARVLAGFIHSCGLLEPGCQNLIPYAMKLFKAEQLDFEILQKFRSTYGRKINIHFLGLWDSVSTTGWLYNPVFLPFTTNNKSVQAVRHALAIDERRSFFKDMRWGDKYRDAQDIKEVWFAGVHSDVGGGYPEARSGLAKIALKWMIEEATNPKFGLNIDQEKYARYVLGAETGKYIGPDSSAEANESLKGAWRLVQWIPKSVWLVDEGREAIRWPRSHRTIESGATLHHSVLERMRALPYKPPSLKGLPVEEIEASFEIEGG
jgi:uncharacterized protein (DUF2235 family)